MFDSKALFLLGPQLTERTWNSVSKRHVCHVLSKVMGVGKVDYMTFASEVFRFVRGDNVVKEERLDASHLVGV